MSIQSSRELHVLLATPYQLFEGTVDTDGLSLADVLQQVPTEQLVLRRGKLCGQEGTAGAVFLADCMVVKSQIVFAVVTGESRPTVDGSTPSPCSDGQPVFLLLPGYIVVGRLQANAFAGRGSMKSSSSASFTLVHQATIRPTVKGAAPIEAETVLVNEAFVSVRTLDESKLAASVKPGSNVVESGAAIPAVTPCLDQRVYELVRELQELIGPHVDTGSATAKRETVLHDA